jgi:hypothetical protein
VKQYFSSHRQDRKLAAKGKPIQVVVTAIARELLAFIWAIGQVAGIRALAAFCAR